MSLLSHRQPRPCLQHRTCVEHFCSRSELQYTILIPLVRLRDSTGKHQAGRGSALFVTHSRSSHTAHAERMAYTITCPTSAASRHDFSLALTSWAPISSCKVHQKGYTLAKGCRKRPPPHMQSSITSPSLTLQSTPLPICQTVDCIWILI